MITHDEKTNLGEKKQRKCNHSFRYSIASMLSNRSVRRTCRSFRIRFFSFRLSRYPPHDMSIVFSLIEMMNDIERTKEWT